MSETKAWLRRPRYSVVHVTVFSLLMFGVVTGTAYWCVHRIWIRAAQASSEALRAVFSSPLPAVLAVPDEKRVPATYQHRYKFTHDWTSRNIASWTKLMEPWRGKPGVQYLEIGVFEGGSLFWMLENILTDPTAHATGIDFFEDYYKDIYFSNLRKSELSEKVTTLTGYSQVALRTLPLDTFDVIYVDGSHAKDDALEDAVLAWRLLKKDGLLIFDDYRRVGGTCESDTFVSCKPSVDAFVACFEDHCQVVHNSFQLIVRKTDKVFPR